MFTIKNHFKSNWEDGIKNSSKLAIYSQFKCYLIPESYLEIINIRKKLIALSKFRCSNHQLAIEQGRHSQILMTDRIFVLCNARNCVVVEDEYHFLLICDDYKLLRHRYVTKHLPPYDETQNGFQIFINLMKTSDKDAMRDVACLNYHAMNVRKRLIANLI